MYKIIQSTCSGLHKRLFLPLLLLAGLAHAQQGSQGNTTVFGGAQMTLFGAHTFVAGGSGVQPGIVKTVRTAPFGILGFSGSATYSGADDANHVDGYVSKDGTSAFVFPVGDGTKQRPVSISAPASEGTFKAAYWFENPDVATLPAGSPFPVANLGTGVTAVSTKEYWDLDGASSVNVTLSWDAASDLNTLTGSTIGSLVIVGYNTATGLWESLGNAGGTTGALTTTGSVTANGVTPDTYAAFTFGSTVAATTPDLRPYIVMANVAFNTTDVVRPFTARIRNVRAGTTATDLVTVRIYKPTPGSVITLTGGSAAEWTITSSGTYYTLTTNSDIPASPLGNSITATVSISSGTAAGTYPLRVFIPDLSGGEVLSDNTNNNLIVQLYKN